MSNSKSNTSSKSTVEGFFAGLVSGLELLQETIEAKVFFEDGGGRYDLTQVRNLKESSAAQPCVHATVNKHIRALLTSAIGEYLENTYNSVDSDLVLTINRIAAASSNFDYIVKLEDDLREFVTRTKNSQQTIFPKLTADQQRAIDDEDYMKVMTAMIVIFIPCYIKKVQPGKSKKPTQADPRMVATLFISCATLTGTENSVAVDLARRLFVPQTRVITDKSLTKSSKSSKTTKKEPEIEQDETEEFM